MQNKMNRVVLLIEILSSCVSMCLRGTHDQDANFHEFIFMFVLPAFVWSGPGLDNTQYFLLELGSFWMYTLECVKVKVNVIFRSSQHFMDQDSWTDCLLPLTCL